MKAWLLSHWRLKLLSVVLAIILFGAVAFAQNPVRTESVTVPISQYEGISSDLVLITSPRTVTVQLEGLDSAISGVTKDEVRAVMDLSKVHPPAAGSPPATVEADVNVQVAAQGVNVQQGTVHSFVTVDRIVTLSKSIDVSYQAGRGIQIDKKTMVDHDSQQPVTQVAITGAASLVQGLQPYVDVGPVQGNVFSPGLPILFKNSAGQVRWPLATVPPPSTDVTSVDVTITAHQQYQQEVKSVIPSTAGQPAACNQPVLSVSPQYVTVTGTTADLSQLGLSIPLNAIDITGASSTIASRQVVPLPANLGSLQVTPSTVTVTVSFVQVCTQPSPAPTPSPTAPSPSPSPT